MGGNRAASRYSKRGGLAHLGEDFEDEEGVEVKAQEKSVDMAVRQDQDEAAGFEGVKVEENVES